MRRLNLHRKTKGILPFLRLERLDMGTWYKVLPEDMPRRISEPKQEHLDNGLAVAIGYELYRRVDWEACRRASKWIKPKEGALNV